MSQGRQKRIRRSRLRRFLEQFSPRGRRSRESDTRVPRGDRLKLENLERRQLLAGDIGSTTSVFPEPVVTHAEVGLFLGSAIQTSQNDSTAESGLTVATNAEGEPAPDLVQFAQDLATAGVVFYGADWCPACTEQKQLFGDGGDDLPFIEVTNPDRTLAQIGIDNNISAFPTWEFPDNSRETGVLTLQELSDRSGVAIPQSEAPSFVEIGDQTVLGRIPIAHPDRRL